MTNIDFFQCIFFATLNPQKPSSSSRIVHSHLNHSSRQAKVNKFKIQTASEIRMDPEFERRLTKPNAGSVRTLPNGMLASPLSSPIKSVTSPMSSVCFDFSSFSFHENFWINKENFFCLQPSLRKQLFRSSPLSSPSKERYGDRFIPVRNGNTWDVNFSNIPVSL